MKLWLGLSMGALVAGCISRSSSAPRPPATKTEPVRETLHGVEVSDPYRWLEGDNADPEDCRKSDAGGRGLDRRAERLHARGCSTPCHGRAALEARLRPLMEIGSVTAPRCAATATSSRSAKAPRTSRSSTGAKATGRRSRPDRSGDDRRLRPHDGRVVVAVARRPAARVRHVSRRRREHDAAPDRGRQRQGAAASRFPTRPRRPTGCPTAPGSSTRT